MAALSTLMIMDMATAMTMDTGTIITRRAATRSLGGELNGHHTVICVCGEVHIHCDVDIECSVLKTAFMCFLIDYCWVNELVS